MHDDFDVAVIGYGPTGLVAASLLGQLGHRVVVCERWPALYGLPRFTHIDGETARIIHGAADIDRALEDSAPTTGTFTNAAGQVLLFIPTSERGLSGFGDHISVYQPAIEAAIDERVRSCATVDVRQGWALTGLTQDADGVTLSLGRWPPGAPDAPGHVTGTVRARWVIAADGAKSRVRELLGVDQDDFGFNERWVNFDAEWQADVPDRFHDTVQVCDPARGHMTMRIGHKRQRFEFALLDGEDPAEMERPETAWSLLKDKYGVGPGDLVIIRNLVYAFEARVARQWKAGRVMLAGDAAHTMPPYLGQGGCSGIRDAANLAWKLDLVLRGLCPAGLLDTYELERRPHAIALVHGSIALGRIANTRDPQQAAARDAAFLSGHAPPAPGMPPLTAGVLHAGPGGGPVPPAGTLTPQGIVRRGGQSGRLDDLAGTGFLLVTRFDIHTVLTLAQRAFLSGLGVRVVHLGAGIEDIDGVLTGYLGALKADAYLARPDFVLFGAARADDLGALVDDLRYQLETRARSGRSVTPVGPASAPPLPAAVAALHRAMPFTRLTDCGMDHADARELLAATAAGACWEDVAAELGERQHRRSAAAEETGHLATAREASRSAAAAFLFAQMARNHDDEIKQRRHRRYVEALTRCAALQVPAIERVKLPYRGGHLAGWLCRPAGGAAGATVIVWGGLSGWGGAYLPVADALTRRGLACLLAEGPGQGESRLVHGVYADTDIALGFARFIDAVRDDSRLGDRVGIQGNSFGGLFAALLASSDPRIGACVINGAPPAPRVPGFRSAREQVLALLGTDDETRAGDVLRGLAFDPRRRRITCPLLVLHGEADPLVTQDEQKQFIAGADPATSRFRTWADGEHTLYNHAAERNALTADWFADQLLP